MKNLLILLASIIWLAPVRAQDLTQEFDALLLDHVEAEGPGAAVLVSKNGEVIYRKAFGMADVALKKELSTESIFRIGSITKQFTAVAILQLIEKGKLTLKDDLTKFFPEYPPGAGKVTVEHLLNHTSGIKSYTNMEAFDPVTQQKKVSTRELLDFFKDEAFEFEPGTKWNYNNSGYVLLGMIIEKVSGRSYGEYVEEEFFQKLGMRSSSYARDDVPVKGHATGYAKGPDGWAEAQPLSMTWPYAAGSLLSTVDDLYAWNSAVMSGKMIGRELMEKAHMKVVLPSGDTVRYGLGWSLSSLQGSPTIEHGGGINGFVTNAIFLPRENVYVVVLTNQETDLADDLSARLAAFTIGRPYSNEQITLSEEELREYTGVYEDKEGTLRYLRLDGDGLVSQRAGGSRLKLRADARDHFVFEGSLTQVTIRRNANGGITGLTMHNRTFGDTEWTRTDKALPVEEAAIELRGEDLERFIGVYELMPGSNLTVSVKEEQLMAQATGQQAFELFASSPTRFFLKAIDAQIEFLPNANGRVDRLMLYQGGGEVEGKRLE